MVNVMTGKLSDNSIAVLERRYLIRDEEDNVTESPKEMFRRVAHAIASQEKSHKTTDKEVGALTDKFFKMMWDLDFVPNSPTLMNAGTGQGTLSACYVLDIDDSMSSIMTSAHDQAMIEKFGGGIGFSLSGIRPKGRSITTTQGRACGPIAVLKTLSQVGTMITQGGKRDGAHMAIMSVYHPDIEEFISCKTKEGEISNFNISVGADANFMEAVKADQYINFTWPMDCNRYDEDKLGADRQKLKARDLFSKIVTGAWKNGEPGMVWLDKINDDNATPQLGRINATNPCGEQPLLSGESCNLGSINLGNFILESNAVKGFDFDRFSAVVRTCVQFLDNVVDANTHPTEKTQYMNQQTRKIGLGVMGWADLLVRLRIPYDSEAALSLADQIGSTLKNVADSESAALGKKKGSFPAFDKSPLNKKNGGDWIAMRNAWRLSIAPTGTISMIAGASSGIEPLFALSYKKHNMSSRLEGVELFYVNDDLKDEFSVKEIVDDLDEFLNDGGNLSELISKLDSNTREVFVTSDVISPENHVKAQAVWQKYVDSGISKTINLPFTATEEDVWNSYLTAWELGCKGITVYRQGSREKEVLVSTDASVEKSVELPVTKVERPRTLRGSTTKIKTVLGNLYVTVNKDKDDSVYEVFATTGKAGGNETANTEAICRLVSVAMQYGVPLDAIAKQLQGIQSVPIWDNGVQILSTADGISKVLREHMDTSLEKHRHSARESLDKTMEQFSAALDTRQSPACPDCSGSLHVSEGCSSCVSCGYSRCG